MERIYSIKLENGSSYQARGAEELELAFHDDCIIRKEFYTDLGKIIQVGVALDPGKGAEMPAIQRKATEGDFAVAAENARRAANAMRTAKDMVKNLSLQMKLLNAHFSLDGKLLTIQFTADGRVDFRELVKELSRAISTRIELRQIGVRDESAIHGGISVCGQVLCCCRFLREFNSINVRMAKDQDLSLTPSTISGVCGRLKCCLKYEHEGYLELEKTMPRRGEYCECASGRGRVVDRNLLTQEVAVQLEDGSQLRCPVRDIQIIRGERAKPPQRRGNERGNRGGNERGNGGNERGNGGNRNCADCTQCGQDRDRNRNGSGIPAEATAPADAGSQTVRNEDPVQP